MREYDPVAEKVSDLTRRRWMATGFQTHREVGRLTGSLLIAFP